MAKCFKALFDPNITFGPSNLLPYSVDNKFSDELEVGAFLGKLTSG